jgi:hypothetical protein
MALFDMTRRVTMGDKEAEHQLKDRMDDEYTSEEEADQASPHYRRDRRQTVHIVSNTAINPRMSLILAFCEP